MVKNPKSLMTGAAVAALLIFPSLASFTGPMAAVAAPPAPPAPPAAAAPAPPPAATNGNWVRWAPRDYQGNAVTISDVVGTITIAVRDGGAMTVEASGDKQRMKNLQVSNDNGQLKIEADNDGDNSNSVWDVSQWFNFSDLGHDRSNMFVKVTVPRGTRVHIDGLVGDANIGDTYGELKFEAAATKAHIGHVGNTNIDLGGAGRIDIGAVDGDLDIDVGGSGKINVGPTKGKVDASIAGSGDAAFGNIGGGMHVDIAGSGDVSASRVNGPTHVEVAGSGTVKIADGVADPLHVEIMGAGNFTFGGNAVNPHIEALGSGTVKLKSYTGKMDSEGMANVQVGGNIINTNNKDGDDDDN